MERVLRTRRNELGTSRKPRQCQRRHLTMAGSRRSRRNGNEFVSEETKPAEEELIWHGQIQRRQGESLAATNGVATPHSTSPLPRRLHQIPMPPDHSLHIPLQTFQRIRNVGVELRQHSQPASNPVLEQRIRHISNENDENITKTTHVPTRQGDPPQYRSDRCQTPVQRAQGCLEATSPPDCTCSTCCQCIRRRQCASR